MSTVLLIHVGPSRSVEVDVFFSHTSPSSQRLLFRGDFLLAEVGLDNGVIEELAERIHIPILEFADWIEGVQELLGEDSLQALRELASVPSYSRD